MRYLEVIFTFSTGVPGSLNLYRVRDGVPGVLTAEDAVDRLDE